MLRNYLLVAIRLIRRNPGISAINIGGLAIAMTVCLLIIQFVTYQYSYDRHVPGFENIYRIGFTWQWTDSKGSQEIHVPRVWAEMLNRMESDFPEVEKCTWFLDRPELDGVIQNAEFLWITSVPGIQNSPIRSDHFITADSNYFKIFPDRAVIDRALTEPDHVVLSDKFAKKLLGSTDVVGHTIYVNGIHQKVISGVYHPPGNSTLAYDMIFSSNHNLVGRRNSFTYFVKLNEGTNVSLFESKLSKIFPEYHTKTLAQFSNVNAFIQPIIQNLDDIHFSTYANFETLKTITFPKYVFKILLLIALVIFIIALVNYINLSSARLTMRYKEISVRKVIGASNSKVLLQYWTELGITLTVAFVVAVTIGQVTFPYVTEMGLDFDQNFLFGQWWFIPLAFATIFFTSSFVLLTQFLVLKRINLFSTSSHSERKSKGRTVAQKFLLSLQLACTIGLTIGITIINKQVNHLLDEDLGFNSDHVIAMEAPATPADQKNVIYFIERIKDFGEVQDVTASLTYPGSHSSNAQHTFYRPSKSIPYGLLTNGPVRDNFIDFYDIEIVAGRDFKESNPADTLSILLSEHSVHRLEFESNEEALNNWISYVEDGDELDTARHRKARVIGVFRDYYINPLHRIAEKKGLVLLLNRNESQVPYGYICIKVKPENLEIATRKVKEEFQSAFPSQVFNYFHIKESLQSQYLMDQLLRNVIYIFTCIAIVLSFLGLFALTSLILIRKTKEIGVRKVLGASIKNIYSHYAKGYIILICGSSLLAIPLTWYFIQNWLEGYAARINTSWLSFFVPAIALGILIMVLLYQQVHRVSRINPADSLRDE